MTAPYTQSPFQKILPLIQLMEQIRQMNLDQANANISRLPNQGAGMTVQQSGLLPKQVKAKYGRDLAPGEMIAPDTPEAQTSRQMMAMIAKMTPEELDSFGASLVSRNLGVPQITNRAGLAAQARGSQVTAENQVTEQGTKKVALDENAKLVLEGIQSIQKATPETRALMGQRLSGLGSPSEEALKGQETNLKAAMTKMALDALADPKHPLNVAMQKDLGFNAIVAAPGVAMGMTQMLDTMAQIAYQRTQGNNAMDLAKLQASLDKDKEFNRVEANWAESVAKNLGGKVSPTVVANWRRWNDAGRPGTAPQGVTPQLDATLKVASDISTQAYINDQAQKGDFDSQMILKLADMVAKVPNKNASEAISEIMAKYYGRVVTTKNIGPRPDGPAGLRWDATADLFAKRFDRVQAKSMWTGGGVSFKPGVAAPAVSPNALTRPDQTGQGGALAPNSPAAPGAALSPEDQQSLELLMKALMSGQVPAGVNLTPAGQPPVRPGTP